MGAKIEEIGKLIRKERINMGLTQEELGQKVGVGKAQISKIENGQGSRISTLITNLDSEKSFRHTESYGNSRIECSSNRNQQETD